MSYNIVFIAVFQTDEICFRVLSLFSSSILEFPKGCNTYESPHSRNCYETIWEDVGCSREGLDNVVGNKFDQVNNSNIR